MCGIVGYVGSDRDATEVLIGGLRRLEYRGYDSSGVAVFSDEGLSVRRAMGKLSNLEKLLLKRPLSGKAGIGHTRWATHGKPSERNAHPHRSGRAAIVHNGIIENYREIRAELENAGREVLSDTDTELVAHLIDLELEKASNLLQAVRKATQHLVGSFAMAAVDERQPEVIVVAKNGGSPLILGLGVGETFLASDIPAIVPYTRQMLFVGDGEFAVLTEAGAELVDSQGHLVEREPKAIQWDPISAEKGGYDRFMQKEIFEQPRALRETIGTRITEDDRDVDLDGIEVTTEWAAKLERVFIVACGTAYYAGMVGKYMIEQLAGIPVEADLASEFRYRNPIVNQNCLLIPVSQSGETADTLAAMKEGAAGGARVLSVCNVRDATIARESHDVLYTHAGPEIGVASTKAFTTQLVALYLIAVKIGLARRHLTPETAEGHLQALRRLPRAVEDLLSIDDDVREVAHRFFHASNFLFLGRGVMYPIALEGALKLKEISYIHAEGHAAGEMKHGPIALIDENMPVVVIANQSHVYEKVVSNLEEVRARDGKIIAVASHNDYRIGSSAEAVIRIPDLGEHLTALLAVIPLQLLAYHVACFKGTDVDQPRNLAKSVTVE